MRPLLLALALARAVALLDSPETPGLRGTISEAAEPAGQYSTALARAPATSSRGASFPLPPIVHSD